MNEAVFALIMDPSSKNRTPMDERIHPHQDCRLILTASFLALVCQSMTGCCCARCGSAAEHHCAFAPRAGPCVFPLSQSLFPVPLSKRAIVTNCSVSSTPRHNPLGHDVEYQPMTYAASVASAAKSPGASEPVAAIGRTHWHLLGISRASSSTGLPLQPRRREQDS